MKRLFIAVLFSLFGVLGFLQNSYAQNVIATAEAEGTKIVLFSSNDGTCAWRENRATYFDQFGEGTKMCWIKKGDKIALATFAWTNDMIGTIGPQRYERGWGLIPQKVFILEPYYKKMGNFQVNSQNSHLHWFD